MKNTHHIHLIGIGGTGLSAIARVLLEQGYQVSGSDMQTSPLAESISEAGATVFIGHKAHQITGADLIVRSSAIPDNNPEIIAAKAAGIPIYKRSQFLGKFLESKDCYAVAGTHGKTTTTSMLAWVLHALNFNPSYIIGGVSKNLNNNAHAGDGNIFVIEADEYDNMFHGLDPKLAIITNMQHDHPDCFPTMQDYKTSFVTFLHRLKSDGTALVCADEPNAASLVQDAPPNSHVFTYGFNNEADYQIHNLQNIHNNLLKFDISFNRKQLQSVVLQVPGKHNAQNACAVLAACHQSGFDIEKAATALNQFEGSKRRFDIRGTIDGITIIDDYAHHPTEIAATMQSARQCYPNHRIWAVWQPHTYSRTQTLMNEFINCFDDADCVVITEVYAAREKNDSFSARQIAEKIKKDKVYFTPQLEDAAQLLFNGLRPNDVMIVCSAGNAIEISKQVFTSLKNRSSSDELQEQVHV